MRIWFGFLRYSKAEGVLKAQKTLMLLYPTNKTIMEYQTLLNLRISQRKINARSIMNKKGKASPNTAITHESVGRIYGARQESIYKTAVMILSTTRVLLVKMRRRDGINASYEK